MLYAVTGKFCNADESITLHLGESIISYLKFPRCCNSLYEHNLTLPLLRPTSFFLVICLIQHVLQILNAGMFRRFVRIGQYSPDRLFWLVLDAMQLELPAIYMETKMSFHSLQSSRNDFLGKKEKYMDTKG